MPGTLLFIPLYQILSSLGLINSYPALMLTYPTFLLPFATWVMLGYWIFIQVVSSMASPEAGGGVAYMAHIGGFLAGALFIMLFRNPRLVRAKRSGIRLPRQEIEHGGWW